MFRHGPTSLPGPTARARWNEKDLPDARADRPFRADLVERVRREIADGTYDTPEKFDIALDRLLRRLEQDD